MAKRFDLKESIFLSKDKFEKASTNSLWKKRVKLRVKMFEKIESTDTL